MASLPWQAVTTNPQKSAEAIVNSDLTHNPVAELWVKANKGRGGIDKVGVEELLPYLRDHKEELTESLLGGRYRPNPVRRVEIPKENGKMRQLGIPTVVDRVVQQSIVQVLSQVYERSSRTQATASDRDGAHTKPCRKHKQSSTMAINTA